MTNPCCASVIRLLATLLFGAMVCFMTGIDRVRLQELRLWEYLITSGASPRSCVLVIVEEKRACAGPDIMGCS